MTYRPQRGTDFDIRCQLQWSWAQQPFQYA